MKGRKKQQPVLTQEVIDYVNSIIEDMNAKEINPHARELILYIAWRWQCATNDRIVAYTSADDDFEQYWGVELPADNNEGYN